MNNKEETKLAHNAIAEKYFELYKDDTTDLVYFDKFLNGLKNEILDLGCGMGHYSNYMSQKGFKVTGVDFSSKMIDIAKANFKGIDFIVGDICNLEILQNKKFDGIVVAYVLQHLSKQEVLNFFKNLNQYLKPDAKILLFLREGEGVIEEIEPINDKFKYVINEYSKEEITSILKENGWKNIHLETKDYVEDEFSLAPTTIVVMADKK
ncbi:MAG: class I SAM-dependent methyltransferase [Clostridia bacterium]|nr:class I SAM-dependent methyltransferase [Clostridia bacterium]